MSESRSLRRREAVHSRRRAWFQFSLRSLLLAITLFSVWLGFKVNAARRQKAAVEALRRVGWQVQYDFEAVGRSKSAALNRIQRLVGIDYFADVVSVSDSPRRVGVVLVQLFSAATRPHADQWVGQLSALAMRPRPGRFLRHVEAFPRLRALNLYYSGVSDDDLVHLRNLTELHELRIGKPSIEGPGLKHLARLQNLRALSLEQDLRMHGGALATMPALKNLRELDLAGSKNVGAGDDLAWLALCPHVCDLNLQDTAADDEAARHIGACRELRRLDLWKCRITDKGSAELCGLGQLQVLRLDENKITDEVAVQLCKLAKLKKLGLRDTEIGDAGLERLGALKNIKSIDVCWTWVTDRKIRDFAFEHPAISLSWAAKPFWQKPLVLRTK